MENANPCPDPAVASADAITIKVQRQFSAPPDRVFAAWLDSASVGKWLFKTPDGEMTRVEVDPHVGGSFTIVEKRGDVLAEHFGTYVKIEPPYRLMFAFSTDMESKPSLITIEVTPMVHGCDLVLTHAIDPKWADFVDRARAGWSMILDGLNQHLEFDQQ